MHKPIRRTLGNRYPMIVEVAGDDPPDRPVRPSCLYAGEYHQGETLFDDLCELSWVPLFESGNQEDLEATFCPDGSVAFLWSRGGPRRLYALAAGDARPRKLLSQMVRLARFSPDGEEIAFLSPHCGTDRTGSQWEWNLWCCDRDGTRPRLIPTPAVPVSHLEYSPNGEFLWISIWGYQDPQARGLYSYHRRSGTLTHQATGDYRDFCFDATGQRLLFVGTRGEQALCLMDMTTGQERVVRWLSQDKIGWGESDLLSPAFSPDGSRIFYSVHHCDSEWALTQLCVTTLDGTGSRVLWEEEETLARLTLPRISVPLALAMR